MLGGPIWLLAIPPLVALVSVLVYVTVPRYRRHPALRGALIVSVGLTALEVMLGGLLFAFLVLWSASGGMENF
jgi:ATP/ADP translocase